MSLIHPRIGVVVLNWNAASLTERCVQSLMKQDYQNIEIIVVDNDSEPSSYESLVATLSHSVKMIRNSKNLGFAGGSNIGIRRALADGCEIVLLMNNDIRFGSGLMRDVARYFSTAPPDVGIMAPLILIDENYPERIYSGGGNIDFLRGRGISKSLGINYQDYIADAINNDYVSGACMAIRSDIFRDVGLLFEDYFAYFEETEFCYRAKMAGWNVRIDPSILIWHRYESRDSEYTAIKHRLLARNRVLFMLRNANVRQAFMFTVFAMIPEMISAASFAAKIGLSWRDILPLLFSPISGIKLYLNSIRNCYSV